MNIKKLPEHLINKIKAGEIVERPASVVKELIENSLDAGATSLILEIQDGGKQSIRLQDNGSGIDVNDLEMVLERYATSKIFAEEDLYAIASYGFRGEALATISEISNFTLQTKTATSAIGYQISKVSETLQVERCPLPFDHGTVVTVQDLFYNVPARQKFLKSAQTEYYYIYNSFVDIALMHFDKSFQLKKNGNTVFNCKAVDNLQDRFLDLFKKDRSSHIHYLEYSDEKLTITGILGDTTLTFGSSEHMKLYVNQRPVQDKIMKRAIMSAYERQIAHGEYPLACVFLQIHPSLVDVNVHPRKLEVKFLDPGSIYNLTAKRIQETLSTTTKITPGTISPSPHRPATTTAFSHHHPQYSQTNFPLLSASTTNTITHTLHQPTPETQEQPLSIEGNTYQLIGQLRDSYIALQQSDTLYLIDQHALAERIKFEQMKTSFEQEGKKPDILLTPISVELPKTIILENKLEALQELGFDVSQISEHHLAIYAVPTVFQIFQVDVSLLFNHLLTLETISLDAIVQTVFATKACKASIKAGQRLSFPQMQQLVEDGFTHIPGMFVCQHGRPFFVALPKRDFDKLFDR